MHAFIAEFIGTFALVFIGAGVSAVNAGGLVGTALAQGCVFIAFAYAYGRFSGCHLNPAITFSMYLLRQVSLVRGSIYIGMQCLGAITASYLLMFILGSSQSGLGFASLARGMSVEQGLVLETVLTFFLANTFLHTVIRRRPSPHAPLAIGLALAFCVLMGGPLTGGIVNPARALGPAIAIAEFGDLWIYIAGPLAGAALAAFLHKALRHYIR